MANDGKVRNRKDTYRLPGTAEALTFAATITALRRIAWTWRWCDFFEEFFVDFSYLEEIENVLISASETSSGFCVRCWS